MKIWHFDWFVFKLMYTVSNIGTVKNVFNKLSQIWLATFF